jgi:hypothetical protein
MFKTIFPFFSLLFFLIFISGCSQISPPKEGDGVKIIGTVTYDRVPVKVSNYGMVKLDYPNTIKETAKHLLLKVLDKNEQVLSQTTTDKNGNYTVYVPKNTKVKIRVYARMLKENIWDVSVADNTQQKALYVIEGALHDSGNKTTRRNLHASSGWNGSKYVGERDAGPFAIIDSINTIMQKVIQANPDIVFPQLTVNWSINNIAAGGDRSLGQIVTSNYDGNSNLWILGDENSDTDEYDDHIIIHEWGHFFEDKFSRSDSIGGPHSAGDSLDIRVAFGEGFGNALSAIATDNPIYFDTAGEAQATGWFMDIESASHENPGWFSEASIQRILYDLYDANKDANDNINLGFTPIYNTMVNGERNAKAFTSIFSFIHSLKRANPSLSYYIDEVVSNEQISPIHDIYGNYRQNSAFGTQVNPVYRNLLLGQTGLTQCNNNSFGVYNKLGNRTYMKVTIYSDGIYNFDAQPYGGAYGDPDIIIYKAHYPFKSMGMSPLEGQGSDRLSLNLSPGEYIIEVYDASFNNSCFKVTLSKEQLNYKAQGLFKPEKMRKPKYLPQY